jgi:hypothetical protein
VQGQPPDRDRHASRCAEPRAGHFVGHADDRISSESIGSRSRSELDLTKLRADPALVDHLDADALLNLLDHCSREHDQLAAIELRVQARLRRELPVMGPLSSEFPSDDDACLDDAQVGRFLQVPESHAADLRRRGDLPEVAIGGKYKRVRVGDLRSYILRQRAIGAGTQR